jgi:hypothetical protein
MYSLESDAKKKEIKMLNYSTETACYEFDKVFFLLLAYLYFWVCFLFFLQFHKCPSDLAANNSTS